MPGGAGLQVDAIETRVAHFERAMAARSRQDGAVAILADNGIDWIALDLAAHRTGVALVPLPGFFTPAQWRHAIDTAGVQALFCAEKAVAHALGFLRQIPSAGPLLLFEKAGNRAGDRAGERASERASQKVSEGARTLAGIQKVTFTSGTTSEPKGVCLSSAQQWDLASVLANSLAGLDIRRHLNLLPLSLLLENIAGVYTALISGAVNIALPLAQVGMAGASRFDPIVCLDAIARERAESVIVLPQMLLALVSAAQRHDPRIRTLKFIAVGGARTPPELIMAARAKGFPVYEGYGLSECGSVVTLNLPGNDRPGSVGRPLPNRRVRIADSGEIEVGGGAMVGYLGGPSAGAEWLGTGDLGHLDEDGFLHVHGRKDNVLVTAYGRNVSPEWPEATLLATRDIAQAVVFGSARPYLVAAIVPARAGMTDADLDAAIRQANATLPDFAQIRRWFRTPPFTLQDGTATANGRVRRHAVAQRCQAEIEQAYHSDGGTDALL